MTHYGVRRLVALNSGNYLYANIDLSRPVHLAAPNNRGKSTLVNALQFLYIDDFSKMRFGRRTHEDTRKHYFGEDRSYLVFECLTTSGIQSMLVRGLSTLRDGHFERYVYDGEFQQADFVNDGEILDFDAVKTRLADRHLARVKNADLWQVLAGNLPPDDGKPIPRLSILPLRRRDEYLAFRDVYVRLLSLSNANARTLRQLIIESHAREIGERKIDVAAEYKDEFDRAERAEHQLLFIRAVADEIDRGKELRLEIRVLSDKLAALAAPLWSDVRRVYEFVSAEECRLNADAQRAESEREQLGTKKDTLLTTLGKRGLEAETVEQTWQKLQEDHKRWSAYSAAFVKGMRSNAERKAADIAEQERHLEQAKKLDLDAMRRQVATLTKQVSINRKVCEQWEKTAIAELRRVGVADIELDSAFRIANPDLLKLIVGDTITFKNLSATADRIRAIANHITDGNYVDDLITADTSSVTGPDSHFMHDPKTLQDQITLHEEELREQLARLNIAEDQDRACTTLGTLKREHEELRRELAEYDVYLDAWTKRDDLKKELDAAVQKVADIRQEIADLEQSLKTLSTHIAGIQHELGLLNQQRERLSAVAQEFRGEAKPLGLHDLSSTLVHDRTHDDAAQPRSLTRFLESVIRKLVNSTTDLRGIGTSRLRLQEHQKIIAEKSRQFEAQQRYFSDEDEEWESLIEARDSLPQLESATERSWDSLFTTLGARLKAIVTAVSSIKMAVERINRGLKTYQVSNLLAVQIKVEEARDTYSAVEALSSQDGLFQDRGAWDINKKRLRQMIDRNEPIELESLFELRIHTQATDGTWHQSASLDDIGSTGTGMTVKAMIFIQLVRAIAGSDKYRLHFYIDGLGELDDRNLEATAAMAVSRGIIPITADPRLHLEPLAHPEVTVYSLGQESSGRFFIDSYKTYHARRRAQPVEVNRE